MKQIVAAAVLGGSIIVAAIIAAPHPSAPLAYPVAGVESAPQKVVIVEPECGGINGPGGVWGQKALCEMSR